MENHKMIPHKAERISVRQIISEQTLLDNRFKGLRSEALVIKLDGSMHVQTTDKQLIPYENHANKQEIFFIFAREKR